MASMGVSSCPNSPDVPRLIQGRRSGVQQHFPSCSPGTLSEPQTVLDENLANTKTRATVSHDSETQECEVKVATAIKSVGPTLDWAKFLQYVQPERSPHEHQYLFRAHLNMPGESGSYEPSVCNKLFNDRFRKNHTVNEFVEAIEKHLGKSQSQKITGIWQDSIFTSMTPILEWALHTTKNKWKSKEEDEEASLVVFDVRKIRQIPAVALFRISDVVRFLESVDQVHLICAQLREWASNCDEYVAMGRAVKEAVVKVTPWSELQFMPIINPEFKRAFTLRIYREWRDEREYELRRVDEVGRIIVQSANVLAGRDASNSRMMQPMKELILKPGVSFWGINTNASLDDVKHACVEQELVEGLSKTSLG